MHHINVHFQGAAVSLFGAKASGFQRDLLLDATQGRLTRTATDGTLIPELLAAWDYDAQKCRWRFQLRQELSFHNGRRVTAKDIEFSLIAPLISKFTTPERSGVSIIQGAKAVKPDDVYRNGMLEGICVLNDREVDIQLVEAGDDFLADLSLDPSSSIFPIEALKRPGVDLQAESKSSGSHLSWKTHPIGAGVFRIARVENNGACIWLQRVGLGVEHSVASVRLTTGPDAPKDTDILDGEPANPYLQQLRKVFFPAARGIIGVYFDFSRAIVRDQRFRKAIQLALNPQEFTKFFESSKPTSTIIPSNWDTWPTATIQSDLSAAKRLLQAVGNTYDLDDVRLSSLGRPKNGEESAWVKQVIERLREIGLPLKKPPAATGELFFAGFGPSVASASRLFSLFKEGTGWVSKLQQPDTLYNQLLADIVGADKERIRELTRQLHEQFTAQVYAVPLVEQPVGYWINPNKIQTLGEFQDSCLCLNPVRVL